MSPRLEGQHPRGEVNPEAGIGGEGDLATSALIRRARTPASLGQNRLQPLIGVTERRAPLPA
jgi:hypothetical protein